MPSFTSTDNRLKPYVGGNVCIFRNGEKRSYCVYKSSYGLNLDDVENSFDISSGCLYSSTCNNDHTKSQYDTWLNNFF